MDLLWLSIGVLVGLFLAYLLTQAIWRERTHRLQAEFNLWHKQRVQVERAEALTASRRVLAGKYVEQFVPFQVQYTPADMKFLGAPVDYIIFNGLSTDTCEEIVFLEVKSNNATLSAREKSVRAAIQAGKVRYEAVQLNARLPTT